MKDPSVGRGWGVGGLEVEGRIIDSKPFRGKKSPPFLSPCRVDWWRAQVSHSDSPWEFQIATQVFTGYTWTWKWNSHVWTYTQSKYSLCECGCTAERSAEKQRRVRCVRDAQPRREIPADFLVPGFWSSFLRPKVLPRATGRPPFPYFKTLIFA